VVAAVFTLLVAQFGLGHVRDYLDDRTFVLDYFPRWTPEHSYHEPLPPRQFWVEVDYQFH
jgi:hypothetical protein